MTKLLLDLGGVVIKTPFEMLHYLGHPPWTGPFDPAADALWRCLQRQEITERDYWGARADELGAGSLREMFRQALDHSEPEVVRPEIAELVAEVAAPAALTNDMSAFHSREWIDRMTVLKSFDPLIDLSDKPFLKPEPAAFEFALELLRCPADSVLFVDDQPFNLIGAEEVGIRTCWFDVTDVTGSILRIKAELDGR